MLLINKKGSLVFESIRTVHRELCQTYRSECEKLGLLDNDHEWFCTFNEVVVWATFNEVVVWATPLALCTLFSHMLFVL